MERDSLDTFRSSGLLVTVEFPASGREEAEDKALEIGGKLFQLTSFYGGSPGHTPLLRRLGRVGPNEGLLEQNEYFYLDDCDRLRQIAMKPYEFQKLLERMGELPEDSRRGLELAIRWYVVSLSSDHSLDGYLAAWVGFEAIGAILSERYHPEGPSAACSLCGNPAGKRRDRKFAGIDHMVRRSAPELLDGRTVSDLKHIRDDIAHCLKPVDQLRDLTDRVLRDLQLSLAIGILTGADRGGDHHQTFSSFLPRENEVRPDARATIRFGEEYAIYKPYYERWLGLEREFVNQRSRMKPDGGYVWGAGTTIRWRMENPAPSARVSEYVMFDRDGMNYEDIGKGGPAVPVIPWRNRTIPLSWRHMMGEATGELVAR